MWSLCERTAVSEDCVGAWFFSHGVLALEKCVVA